MRVKINNTLHQFAEVFFLFFLVQQSPNITLREKPDKIFLFWTITAEKGLKGNCAGEGDNLQLWISFLDPFLGRLIFLYSLNNGKSHQPPQDGSMPPNAGDMDTLCTERTKAVINPQAWTIFFKLCPFGGLSWITGGMNNDAFMGS